MFADRTDAGRRLVAELLDYRDAADTVVFGIPRGGVIVAAEVAAALHLPLDVALAAKVGAPGNVEYAIGAVGADGVVVTGAHTGHTPADIEALAAEARAKLTRGLSLWSAGHPARVPRGGTAILVDDGLATGLTARAAADWLHRAGAARVIVAVPVASPEAAQEMRAYAEEVVAIEAPAGFFAVGQVYGRFEQTTDAEVQAALSLYRR